MVDQECIALAGAGHRVERFEKFSDDIEHFSAARKVLLPAQALWSTSSARALRHVVEAFKPDVVHVHNLFPLLSPSVMQVCRRRQIPVVATIHNYTLICSSGTLFRSGAICRECVGRHPLPAIRHRCYQGSALATTLRATAAVSHQHAWRTVPSAYIFISEAQQAEFVSLGLPRDRCFVKGNFVVPGAPKQPTEDLLVFLGRMNEEKGLPLLMAAWDLYTRDLDRPGLRLVLAGFWSARRGASCLGTDAPFR